MSARFGPKSPLVKALRAPETMTTLAPADWESVLALGLTGALQGVLAGKARKLDFDGLPRAVRHQFEGVESVTAHNRRVLAWEANRIDLALRDVGCPVILLKGAAYQAIELPSLRGRLASDVDILVPKADIGRVEAALKDAGWQSMNYDEYDQHYYREWMHEIPPLKHGERGTYIDVHHTILPETGRLTPDVDHLFAHARPLPDSCLSVLGPADMVLHTIVHCFQDGEFSGRLRDIVDVQGLFADFGQQQGFWDELLEASDAHGFGRPLYYALYFCRTLLDADIPDDVMRRARKHAPNAVSMAVMRFAVPRAVTPPSSEGYPWSVKLAQTTLLARSHWLKMPPWMLLKHLSRKAVLGLLRRQ